MISKANEVVKQGSILNLYIMKAQPSEHFNDDPVIYCKKNNVFSLLLSKL